MRVSGALDWLRARDEGLTWTKRAVRVTVAACLGFYVCRYAFDESTMATYAIFGTLAFGALSEVTGRPAERTRILLGCLGIGVVLVTLGTFLAVSPWAASAGMAVVGFAVAFAGVGGPRFTGVANGLQLLYILPCFPPFAPDTLPHRLIGLAIGVGLVILADRLLWPAPAPPTFQSRLAEVSGLVAAQLRALSAVLEARWAGADPVDAGLRRRLADRQADAADGVDQLRPIHLPAQQRPAGPGTVDRGLTHAATAIRGLHVRLAALTDLIIGADPAGIPKGTPDLLRAIGDALEVVRAGLAGTGPAPAAQPLEARMAAHTDNRLRELTREPSTTDLSAWARLGVEATEAADTTRTLVLATRAVLGAPEPPSAHAETTPNGAFWYAGASPGLLWWRRLKGNLTLRSVYLQNAVRLAIGLAVARLVAGELDLYHGFWVLLAILTVMRTSVVATGIALVPALGGTLVGAAVVTGIVAIHPPAVFFAVLLPISLLLSVLGASVLGLAVGQCFFTITIALVFAQLAPIDARLGSMRLVDVLLGGLVGLLAGIVAWPRGGRGEVRRAAAACLAEAADYLEYAANRLAFGIAANGGKPGPEVRHLVRLFDTALAQYSSERTTARDDPVAWLTVLTAAHRVARGATSLLHRYPSPDPLPWPSAADELRDEGARVAEGYRHVASALRQGGPLAPPNVGPGFARGPGDELVDTAARDGAGDPHAAMRLLDAWGWFSWLVHDLARVDQVTTGAG